MAPLPLSRWLRLPILRAIDYALPPRCPGCGAIVGVDHSFCLPCWQRLDFLGGPACGQCAEPLALARGPDARCGACLADPPPFARLHAGVAYGEVARALALKLKHGGRPGIAETMARTMARGIGPLDPDTLIVPVPLHRWRIWSRGYNQAALIARALAARTGGTLAIDLLVRRRATPMLRAMGPAARARTVSGAFAVNPACRLLPKGRRMLLIDDVYTTGATVRACARVLRRAGAAEVRVGCWARVTREPDDELELVPGPVAAGAGH